jgi:hypothetical protein
MPNRTAVRIIWERQFLLRVLCKPQRSLRGAQVKFIRKPFQHINRAAPCFLIGSLDHQDTISI